MEDFLRDLDVWCWRYAERSRNYPGLHFTAKPAACEALLRCLDVLRREGAGAYRTIPLRRLWSRDEAKVTGGLNYQWFEKLRLTLSAESDQLRQMSFRVEAGMVRFDFTESRLVEFERGIRDVQGGKGDYSISALKDHRRGQFLGELDRLSECLWFWPCFGHLSVVE